MSEITEALSNLFNKDSSYEAIAEVLRIDGDTAYIHFDGGEIETPASFGISVKSGDKVRVRVGNGHANIIGNLSAPPTDDTIAKIARKLAEWVTADRIDIDSIFAKDILATGTISGAKLRGADGRFTEGFYIGIPSKVTPHQFTMNIDDTDTVIMWIPLREDPAIKSGGLVITPWTDGKVMAVLRGDTVSMVGSKSSVQAGDLLTLDGDIRLNGTVRMNEQKLTDIFSPKLTAPKTGGAPDNVVTTLGSSTTPSTVGSITLNKGTYLIIASVRFASNATGRRVVGLSDSQNSNSWYNELSVQTDTPVNGAVTYTRVVTLYTCDTDNKKVYINAYQNSGSSLAIVPRCAVVKLF